MVSDEVNVRSGRVPLAEALRQLRRADELTDAGFTDGLRDTLVRFAELFDDVWDSDPTFRERWRPRVTTAASDLQRSLSRQTLARGGR